MKKYKMLAILIFLVVIVTLPFSVSAKTKGGVSPGSFFYFFDKAFEKADLFFTFNPEKKAKKALENAEERLAEAEESASENNHEAVETAIKNYQENISLAEMEAKAIKDEIKTKELLLNIASSTSKHQEILTEVLNKVPEQARQAIQKAIEASKKGVAKEDEKTAELKKEVSEIKSDAEEVENELIEEEDEEKTEVKDDEKDDQSKEIDKLRKEVEALKQKQSQVKIIEKIIEKEKPITVEDNQSSGSQTKQNENIVTLPSGTVVEMDEDGNIVRTIKEVEATPQATTFKHVIVSAPQYVSKEIRNGWKEILLMSLRLQSVGDAPVKVEEVNIRIVGPIAVIKKIKIENCGISQLLNDEGETTLACTLNIKNGSSNNYNIVADISDDISAENGKTIQVSVESIKADGAVISGEFPIVSAPHKIIAPPVIVLPKVTVSPGKVDYQPNKAMGTKDYVFSSIKISTDKKIFIQSIRWNMSASGSLSQLENLKTYIDDIFYSGASSSDGKYFTSNFGGVVINPNEMKEIYIKGDVVSGKDYSLKFNIYKNIDLVINDENGNTVIAKPEQLWDYDNSGGFRSGNPWYDGYKVEVTE